MRRRRQDWVRRQRWMREFLHRLVFPDETSVRTGLTRLRGRCPRGERLHGSAPFGRWHAQAFVAGLTCDAPIAPWILSGAMEAEAFDTYVETPLAPVRAADTVVILDSLSTHRSPRAPQPRSRPEAAGSFPGETVPPDGFLLPRTPAALQPPPRPGRDGVLQAQGPPPPQEGAPLRARPRSPGQHPRPVHAHNAPEPPRSLRPCARSNANRFRAPGSSGFPCSSMAAPSRRAMSCSPWRTAPADQNLFTGTFR